MADQGIGQGNDFSCILMKVTGGNIDLKTFKVPDAKTCVMNGTMAVLAEGADSAQTKTVDKDNNVVPSGTGTMTKTSEGVSVQKQDGGQHLYRIAAPAPAAP